MLTLILSAWLMVVVFMIVVWGLYLCSKNPGIIDIAWAIAISMTGLVYLFSTPLSFVQIMYVFLLCIWACRLSGYLLITRIIPKHVDKRYLSLSEQWKMKKSLGFLINYQFQGVLAVIIATPFLFIRFVDDINTLALIAMLAIAIGIIGETIADQQLQTFRRQQPGKVCDYGLWHYSRHPNYFFEFLIWLGFAVAALPITYGWLAFIAPALLLYFMLKVTGPMTEQGSIESKGEAYLAYQRKTSMFIPLPPKRD